jgi:ribosomal protein S6--L-glutamate ligase
MRIAILSRNKSLHSVSRLLQEAKKQRVQCDVINPLECQLVTDGKNSRILVGAQQIPHFDAVLPRIGASITDYGLAVVRHFEAIGVAAVNSARAIAESRDKMRSLQVLNEAGLPVPKTVLLRSRRGLGEAVRGVGGLPIILKVLRGTQGVGVMLMHTPISLESVMDTLHGLDEDVLLQQFIAEAAGRDYRAFVVGNKVVAAMMRTATEGEFRSNIHRGGEGKLVRLPKRFEQVAIRASRVLGLEVAGVDLMDSEHGPLIIEVNSSPGFEGIEKATGLNIAGQIVQHMKKLARQKKPRRKKPAQRKTAKTKRRS